jgi:metal-dependent amidase/aminoacylase/carboxypeptidase family protein
MALPLDELKDRLEAEVDRLAPALIEASHDIHSHPELGFAEHHAHEVLTAVIEGDGLAVERGAYGLETAFAAHGGETGPTIAVLCEYDALPGIGHACGHNVIAASGLGAGLAAAHLAEAAGGRVRLLGTPAEEGGGGKVLMAEQGAFEGVDAAMMVHVTYQGHAAHAAAAPHKGRNALDAAVLGYVNVAALRQHILPEERVHGFFPEAGDAANIVPERARAVWYVRSPTRPGLERLKTRVLACIEAGAAAAACELEITWKDPAYDALRDLEPFMALYAANAARLGRIVEDHRVVGGIVGSTDMGNVSQLLPSIHPMIKVSPAEIAIHTQDFVRWAASADGALAVVDGAKAMACTVADLWAAPGALEEVQRAFAASPGSARDGA